MPYYLPDCTDVIRRALNEDIGTGDVTTQLIVDPDLRAEAYLIAREAGVVAGTDVVRQTLLQLDPGMECVVHVEDGEPMEPGGRIMTVSGSAQAILTGERVA